DAVPDENIEVDADEIEIEPAEDFIDNKVEDTPVVDTPVAETPVVETPVVDTPVEEPVEETHKKKRDFSKRHDGYGDEPTFGTDKESSEGFYGGEINSEDEVLVDITEDEGPELAEPIENMADKREIVDTSEIDVESLNEPEDLKSTLKSMLQSDDEEDEPDEDNDFEFIDLD
ncbi:MAG: hypothetical protein J6W35_04185, partial [Eubacterium sp.]|nr:hypothetical protein [Eubacterium sp.]